MVNKEVLMQYESVYKTLGIAQPMVMDQVVILRM